MVNLIPTKRSFRKWKLSTWQFSLYGNRKAAKGISKLENPLTAICKYAIVPVTVIVSSQFGHLPNCNTISLRLPQVVSVTTCHIRNAVFVDLLRLRQVVSLATCFIRNILTVCFLPASVWAVDGIRSLWGKGFAAAFAQTVSTSFTPPLCQFLLIPTIAA